MYTITLSDGTALTNLTLNGENFIAPAESDIDKETFEGKLSEVTITSDDPEVEPIVLHDALLAKCERADGEINIVLLEKTPQQKAAEAIQKALTTNNKNITDLQLALTEVYELIIGQ